MVSMLLWQREQPAEAEMPLFLVEAPYLEPLVLDDEVLADTVRLLGLSLHGTALSQSGTRAPAISSDGEESTVPGSPGAVSIPLEGNTDA